MVKMMPISKNDLGPMIYMAFKADYKLINTYHMVNGSLELCVESTKREIDRVAAREFVTYYGVYWNDQPIGFTVTGDRFLLSFGISIYYRTKDIVMQWWDLVCECLPHGFVTWIWKKNTRAIQFLTRNGMEQIEDAPGYYTLIRPEPIISSENIQPCQQED